MVLLLPTKGVSPERALLTIGSEILENLRNPMSISALWESFNDSHSRDNGTTRITFDWFSLAVSTLYAIKLIEETDAGYIKRANVP